MVEEGGGRVGGGVGGGGAGAVVVVAVAPLALPVLHQALCLHLDAKGIKLDQITKPLVVTSEAKLTKLMAGEELGLLRLRFSGCCPPLCPFSCGGLSPPSLGLLLGGESRPEEPFLLMSTLEQAPTESPDLRRGRACLRRGC